MKDLNFIIKNFEISENFVDKERRMAKWNKTKDLFEYRDLGLG